MNARRVERVAITGLGMVTSLGRNATESFRRLVCGDVGIKIASLDLGLPLGDLPVAEVKMAIGDDIALPDNSLQGSRCDTLALHAAREALAHAELGTQPFDLIVGETAGPTREAVLDYSRVSPDDAEPFFRRMVSEPMGATGVRLRAALPQLVSSAVVCSACSSGALAIALGAMRLQQNAVRPQLVGGADALNALTLVGFGALGALSKEPCRPFDSRRNGLNLGEGAAFLVLETERMVRSRTATVLAWLDGYALGAEAHHLTHPEAEGHRASELIDDAMRRAGLDARDVGYINAHGTATPQNDAMEAKAIARVFGDVTERVLVSSSKGQLGHTLGAAGALEAAIVVQALRAQIAVPTMGLTETTTDCALSHVTGQGQPIALTAALSTSFGFGGAGAVLAMVSAEQNNHCTAPQLPEPRIFVRTLVTLGAPGILRGTQNAELLNPSDVRPSRRLPFEPLDLLVMERSRRFDRLTALTALGTRIALDEAGIDGAQVGLVLGNALGEVSRSLEFIKRVRVRGVRGAPPAEFPHLLPSSVSGNASIYSGLRGPVFNVSELGETAEPALAMAVNCLRSGIAQGMLAGTVEVLDEPLCSALISANKLFHTESLTEGAAFLLLEAEHAESSSEPGRCELVWVGPATQWAEREGTDGSPTEHSEVLWGAGDESALAAYLMTIGWGDVPRRTVNARVGTGWHLSGFLYATAAARVLTGAADSVLVVTEPPSGRYLTLFVRR